MLTYKFQAKHLKPVKFYRYRSGISHKILSQNHNYKTKEHDYLQELGISIKEIVKSKGINWDNKIVVECELLDIHPDCTKAQSNIFISYYDNIISIGLSVWSDEWIKPIIIPD